jgi:hypothetical protein
MKINSPIFLSSVMAVAISGCMSTPTKTATEPPKSVAVSFPNNAPSSPQNAGTIAVTQPVPNYSETPISHGEEVTEPTDYPEETILPKPLLDPKQVIEAYYQAISDKNCSKAAQLRPGYAEDRCYKIDSMLLKNAIPVCEDPRISAIYVDIVYQVSGDDKKIPFFGYAKLINRGGQWVIDNDSFKSGKTIDLDEYIKAHNLSCQ